MSRRSNEKKAIAEIMEIHGNLDTQELIDKIKSTLGKTHLSMTDDQIEEYVLFGETNEDLLEVDGRMYGLGDIISIGQGPRLIRGSKPVAPKGKRTIVGVAAQSDETENVPPEDDDYDQNKLDANFSDSDDEAGGDYGDEDEAGDGGGETGGGEDAFAVFGGGGPTKTSKPTGKTTMETGIGYSNMRISKGLSGAASRIAKNLGISEKEARLTEVAYKHQVYQSKIEYDDFIKYEVVEGPGGKLVLQLYKPQSKQLRILDDDDMPPPIPNAYKPKVIRAPTIQPNELGLKFGDHVEYVQTRDDYIEGVILHRGKSAFDVVTRTGWHIEGIKYDDVEVADTGEIPSNMFDSASGGVIITPQFETKYADAHTLRFVIQKNVKKNRTKRSAKVKSLVPGLFAKFTWTRTDLRSGIIMGSTSGGFSVLENGKRDTIPFDHPTLTKIDRLVRGTQDRRRVVAKDFLHKQIRQDDRSRILRKLFDALAVIIPGVFASDVDESDELKQLEDEIDWELLKAHARPREWEVYYAEQFRQWMFSRYASAIEATAPDFSDEVERIIQDLVDPIKTVDLLLASFGSDLFDGNGFEMFQRMDTVAREDSFKATDIDTFIRQELARYDHIKLTELEGKELARYISQLIVRRINQNPPNHSKIVEEMTKAWISNEFSRIQPSDQEQLEFDTEHLEVLKAEYGKWSQNYKNEEKKALAYAEKRDALQREQGAILDARMPSGSAKISGKVLTDIGIKLHKDVSTLEGNIYTLSDKTNISYLRRAFELLLFIDETYSISRHSQYVRAKLSTGMYPVEHLNSAKLEEMFPEFFINEGLTDKQYAHGVEMLGMEIYAQILSFIQIWVFRDVTSRRPKDTSDIMNIWDKYVIDIPTACGKNGGFRIKKDADLTANINKLDDYECSAQKGNPKMATCTAKRELIPNDDVILCYSAEKFVCMSINDVLHALASQKRGVKNPLNPITNEPYTKDFLTRMKRQYGDMIGNGSKYPDRIVRFDVPTEDIGFDDETESDSDLGLGGSEWSDESDQDEAPITRKQLAKIADGKPLVVRFYASWEPPLNSGIQASIDRISQNSDIVYLSVDRDISGGLFDEFRIEKSKKSLVIAFAAGNLKKNRKISLTGKKAAIKSMEKLADDLEDIDSVFF